VTGREKPRKRCRRYDVPWHAHYLTFSCFRKQPFFAGERAPLWFLEALDVARRREPFDLWAYVIMPEHVHVVILPAAGARISGILRAIKKPVADRALGWVLQSAPSFLPRMEQRRPSGKVIRRFWQAGGGYDRNLRSVHDVHEKVEYTHANPVRRGLVGDPGEWPWSSWRSWAEGTDEPIRIDRESFPPLRP